MKDTKIYLITCMAEVERNGYPTGRKELVVSHGVGNNTLKNYVLPTEHPTYFHPKRDAAGEYIDAFEED